MYWSKLAYYHMIIKHKAHGCEYITGDYMRTVISREILSSTSEACCCFSFAFQYARSSDSFRIYNIKMHDYV